MHFSYTLGVLAAAHVGTTLAQIDLCPADDLALVEEYASEVRPFCLDVLDDDNLLSPIEGLDESGLTNACACLVGSDFPAPRIEARAAKKPVKHKKTTKHKPIKHKTTKHKTVKKVVIKFPRCNQKYVAAIKKAHPLHPKKFCHNYHPGAKVRKSPIKGIPSAQAVVKVCKCMYPPPAPVKKTTTIKTTAPASAGGAPTSGSATITSAASDTISVPGNGQANIPTTIVIPGSTYVVSGTTIVIGPVTETMTGAASSTPANSNSATAPSETGSGGGVAASSGTGSVGGGAATSGTIAGGSGASGITSLPNLSTVIPGSPTTGTATGAIAFPILALPTDLPGSLLTGLPIVSMTSEYAAVASAFSAATASLAADVGALSTALANGNDASVVASLVAASSSLEAQATSLAGNANNLIGSIASVLSIADPTITPTATLPPATVGAGGIGLSVTVGGLTIGL